MIHIRRGTEDFKGNDNRQNLSSQTPSYLEVNGKILHGISENKIRLTASAFDNCILQNPHWLCDYAIQKWYPVNSLAKQEFLSVLIR